MSTFFTFFLLGIAVWTSQVDVSEAARGELYYGICAWDTGYPDLLVDAPRPWALYPAWEIQDNQCCTEEYVNPTFNRCELKQGGIAIVLVGGEITTVPCNCKCPKGAECPDDKQKCVSDCSSRVCTSNVPIFEVIGCFNAIIACIEAC